MSLFGAILGREQKSVDVTALTLQSILGEVPSKTGITVNANNALRVSAVLGCCRVLAEGIAQIPFKLTQERPDGSTKAARDHRLFDVLWRRPNDWMTSFEFRETLMYHAILSKGGFAIISRNIHGEVLELLPLVPGNVNVRQDSGRKVFFEVTDSAGTVGVFPRASILHIRGPSWDTVRALEVVRLAREAIGLSIATEESQALLHANGARPAGLLSYERPLTEDQQARIRKSWNKVYGGENKFGTAVLDLGAKYSQLTMSGVDAQHIETRRHQVEEIARMMRVHPQMLGYHEKSSTYASAEQFFTAHVVHGLGPWVERWEQACDRDLLTEEDRAAGYRTNLVVDGLLRGDAKSRSEFYKASLGTSSSPGWNTPNDIRRLENQDPIAAPGADKLVTVDELSGRQAPATGAGGAA
ncbi:MAG: phage portal protein [Deltaproteobacteria bacterium]